MAHKNIIKRIISNSLVQTFLIYVSGGWIALEMTDYFIKKYELNDTISDVLSIILLIGLPIAIFLSWYLSRENTEGEETSQEELMQGELIMQTDQGVRILNPSKRPQIIFSGILILVAIGVSVFFRIQHQSKMRFALDYSLPSLKSDFELLMDNPYGEENWNIYQRAIELRKLLKENPDIDKLWYSMTVPYTINTNPPRAKVYTKPYAKPDTSWYLIGQTPLVGYPFPRGLSRIKIELEDYKTQFDVIYRQYNWRNEADTLQYQLFKENEVPEDMVNIPSHYCDRYITPGLPDYFIDNFWMDRYEVTNKEFKTFLDSGGYTKSIYWEFPFIVEDDTLTLDDAKKRFIDNTGWIGPANWELGNFLKGTDDLPVTGISWYEAAAYAKFVNKSLPTIFHWTYVSEAYAAPEIVKYGNFDKNGPVEKGTYNSMTRFGTYDLPGNVSEWIYNSSGKDRYVLGGNFQEPTYMFIMPLQVSPWIRNELIGFRCIKYTDELIKQDLIQNLNHQKRDYSNLHPVSNEIFLVYKELLEFERVELNPTLISKTITEEWVKEIYSVEVPYEDEPLKILIFLPDNYKPPYQAIVYFPGLTAHHSNSMIDMKVDPNFDFFLESGRAVIWPVYYSSYGRGVTSITNLSDWKQTYKNIIIDVQVTFDYLQTRNDIDFEKVAYYGCSWGGAIAPYILATEERFNLGMLALFGLSSTEKYRFKEFDPIDYLPHVKIPMLLLGGQYDPDFTMETQQAFYDFLGTPKSDIRWKMYVTTHWIPRTDRINESLNWLDKYFGPVNK